MTLPEAPASIEELMVHHPRPWTADELYVSGPLPPRAVVVDAKGAVVFTLEGDHALLGAQLLCTVVPA